MSSTQPAVDRGFLRKVTIATAWGEGLDGYDLGGISVVLALLIAPELHMSAVWTGLIGSSSLLGIFFGAPVFGWFTDRFGRRGIFIADLIVFVVAGLLQFFVQSDWQLFIVRIVLGLAIGAEYSIGAPILSEFVPTANRGNRLASLEVCWYVGYLVSVVAAYALILIPGIGWRLVLASSAVPALITLLLRIGLPESPRWLLSKGREREARAIIDRYLGGEASYQLEDYAGEPQRTTTNLLRLLSPEYRTRTVFLCLFWACLVAPYFAIFTFANVVLRDLNLTNVVGGQILINGVAAVGCFVGMIIVERVGRRLLVIVTFWIAAAALAVTVWSGLPGWGTVIAFMVFSFFNAAQAVLCAIYPNELFPTELRGSAAGISSAASRVGAAIGTFLLPIGLATIGISASMAIGAAILVLGAVISHLWAPETTGKTLPAASLVRRAEAPAPVVR